ncbi:MAG TPA: DUF1269 domain-containing protein [Intrasporangium sp.]|nr:DUF1269 domain-containing protein [Intrasporangium sp.]
MTAFTVWKFEELDGAERAASILKDCEHEGMVKILDHAVVTWPEGEAKPTTRHGHEENWRGTGWGALWGVLVGALFFVPVVGGVVGAAIGAISKMTQDAGITKDQLETIRTQVTPGTSALFVVTEEGDLDRVGERFHAGHSKLIASNLTEAERQVLLETFGGR